MKCLGEQYEPEVISALAFSTWKESQSSQPELFSYQLLDEMVYSLGLTIGLEDKKITVAPQLERKYPELYTPVPALLGADQELIKDKQNISQKVYSTLLAAAAGNTEWEKAVGFWIKMTQEWLPEYEEKYDIALARQPQLAQVFQKLTPSVFHQLSSINPKQIPSYVLQELMPVPENDTYDRATYLVYSLLCEKFQKLRDGSASL